MSIRGPELVTRRNDHAARAHALVSHAWIIRRRHSMETADSAQVKIILGIEDVHAGVARLSQI